MSSCRCLVGAVADADRRGASIALQVPELLLLQLVPAADGVHDLHGAVGGLLVGAVFDPVDEGLRFPREAQPEEAVHGEGGVPDPGVAVVPVADSSYRLREARGGRGHDGAGGREGQQLQGQGRALDDLPPPALVLAARDPLAPKLHGLPKCLVAPELGVEGGGVAAPVRVAEQEGDGVPHVHEELRLDAVSDHVQWHVRREAQLLPAGGEDDAVGAELDRVLVPGIVKGRDAGQSHVDRAAHNPDLPDDLVRMGQVRSVPVDGHEVYDLADALGAEEAGDQDARLRQVHLLLDGGLNGGDLEEAALVRVQDGGENAG